MTRAEPLPESEGSVMFPPPVLLAALVILAANLLQWLFPIEFIADVAFIDDIDPDWLSAAGAILAAAGAALSLAGQWALKRRGADVNPSQPVMVLGDRDELLRVAENLIENAIKYGVRVDSEAAAVVDVAVSSTEKEGSLSVRDYGHGIASEHLPRLTERFYRVDATQSRAKNGTGLGLAIVKHILTRHRGRLTITSRVHQGSCFVATVPLHHPTTKP